MRALLVVTAAIFSLSAGAQSLTRVFVEDAGIEKGVDMDSKALTSSLCASLMKQKGIEVMCAPDIRQLLDFQSQLMLIGKNPAVEKLEKQVESTPWVITSLVQRDGKRIVMVVGLHEKGAAEGVQISAGKQIAVVRERVDKAGKLLSRVDAVSEMLATQLVKGPTKVQPEE